MWTVYFLGVSASANKLSERNLRPDVRVLAEERVRQAQLPRDSPLPAEEEPRLQAEYGLTMDVYDRVCTQPHGTVGEDTGLS